jgi:hypothetical protein
VTIAVLVIEILLLAVRLAAHDRPRHLAQMPDRANETIPTLDDS